MKLIRPRWWRPPLQDRLQVKAAAGTSRLQYIEPELLTLILTFLVDTGQDLATSSDAAITSRASILRSMGFVCRSWQAVSQDLLYEHPRPRSLKALMQLRAMLRMKNGLVRRVKSVSPPRFRPPYFHSNSDWRPQTQLLTSGQGPLVKLSANDYFSMIEIFRDLASMCPNLSHFSFPVVVGFKPFVILPEMCQGLDITQIISLTLSSFPFNPRVKENGQSNMDLMEQTDPICFPKLKKLKLLSLPYNGGFMTDFAISDCIQTPVLEEIAISGMSMTSSALRDFIKPVGGTLISLELIDAGLRLIENPEDIPAWDRPFFPLPRLVPPGIKHFATHSRNIFQTFPDEAMLRQNPAFFSTVSTFKLKTIPSLESMRLFVDIASSLVELDYFYPSLRVLHLEYRNTYTPAALKDRLNFKLITALAHFVKNKDLFAPELEEITLNWGYTGISIGYGPPFGFDWLACCLAYCFRWRCKKYGIKLNMKMEYSESLPCHLFLDMNRITEQDRILVCSD
jgi:hypothetical protein